MRDRRSASSLATLAAAAALSLAFAACTAPPADHHIGDIPPADQAIADSYPTLTELYGGAQGIYRGCGPNGNVCHNARQYPNMNTLGSIQLNIGKPCNQLQDDPSRLDDWCERTGDTVKVHGMSFQLGYIQRVADATDTQGSRWAVAVQGTLPALRDNDYLSIVRTGADGQDQWLAGFDGSALTADPMRDNVVYAQLGTDESYLDGILSGAGVPGDPGAIQFGDANRNGVYGASIGAALILPGHPERSYIIKRLTDPTAGPLMPLANCCFWTKPALRALWCWINSLNADGSNAMDPIDYARCPAGPVENVPYPDPGPSCMAAGLCPVHADGTIPDDPTWSNVYTNILAQRCAGNGCHFDMAAGGLDMHSSDLAYDSLLHSAHPRVVPGDPSMSLLHVRLTQPCMQGQSCSRMPLGGDPLPANELSIIDRWIQAGATMDGTMPDDGGTGTDAAVDAAPDAPADAPADVARDAGTDAAPDVSDDAASPSDGSMDASAGD